MSSTQQLLLAEGAGGVIPAYIEEVFSTYLYGGNSSTQTITNNIDLSTKGGLVWVKRRDAAVGHNFYDTARGRQWRLDSAITSAQTGPSTAGYDLTSFNTTGFSLGPEQYANMNDGGGYPYVSWTFCKQPKFFDVVTYTGNGTSQTITHNLGSTPGCIITKRLNSTSNWLVYHRSISTQNIYLNKTDAAAGTMGITSVGSTTYDVNSSSELNENGGTYVAYIFAHNAGGFGATGTDNVISCASLTTDGSGNATVDLGYEPQWVLIKESSAAGQNWILQDNMRGVYATGNAGRILNPNTTAVETSAGGPILLTSTGFKTNAYVTGATIIYIAIRRGPMKVPTVGTTVFSPNISSGATGTAITTGFPVDLQFAMYRGGDPTFWGDRLRGMNPVAADVNTPRIVSDGSNAETSYSFLRNWGSTGFQVSNNYGSLSSVYWNFRRAPSVFDIVCYAGTGVARTVTHNLGVAPEMMIVKNRSISSVWRVYSANLGATQTLQLNLTDAAASSTPIWNDTAPTSSVFTVGTAGGVNGSGYNIVAYLFATCAGVSKVGSYTGNGTTQTINCSFTTGARFVLIKRTDSAGDWYVYDTARGMTVLTDPYYWLNDSVAEVATLGSVTTVATGFALNSAILADINVSAGTYIFLAIA